MKEYIKKYKNLIICMLGTISIIVLISFLLKEQISIYYNPTLVKKYVLFFGKFGFLFFLLIQIIQVILFFIPGEFVQVAGGYVYGTFIGTILSIVGITVGSIITFSISRRYGNKFLEKILPQNDFEKIKNLIDKPKNKKIVFILYIIPGVPKDIVGYVCGITSIKMKNFIILATLGRIPGILISAYFGSNLQQNDYKEVIIAITITIVLLFIGAKKKDKIIEIIEK